MAVTAGTRDERHAASDQPREITGRHLHAVHREHTRIEKAALVQILHRADAWGDPRRVPDPQLLQKGATRPTARLDELDLLDGLRQMDAAARERIAIRRAPNRPQDQRRDRIGCVGGQARSHASGGDERVQSTTGRFDEPVGVGWSEANQLVEDEGGEPTALERPECHQAYC